MERNIAKYEENYSDAVCGFEKYKIIYRRRKILEIINDFRPETILEIGCGPEPLFCYENSRKFTIVEPSDKFYENAKRLSIQNKNVICIKGFLKKQCMIYRKEIFHMIWWSVAVCYTKWRNLKNCWGRLKE